MSNYTLSDPVPFADVDWSQVPEQPGVYVIYEGSEVLYVGMAGRDGRGSLRNRLNDPCSARSPMVATTLYSAGYSSVRSSGILERR